MSAEIRFSLTILNKHINISVYLPQNNCFIFYIVQSGKWYGVNMFKGKGIDCCSKSKIEHLDELEKTWWHAGHDAVLHVHRCFQEQDLSLDERVGYGL